MLRISSTTLDELHSLLLNKELFMHRKKKAHSTSVTEPFQAFALTYAFSQAYAIQHSSYNNRNNFQRNNRGRGNFQKHNRGRGNYRGKYNNYVTGIGNFRNNSGNYNQNSCGYNHNSDNWSPCQICNSFNHEAIECYAQMNHAFAGKIPPTKLAAMCANAVSSSQPAWLLDFGPTAHVTNDISAIFSPIPYFGGGKVYVGDGQGHS